MIFPGVNSVSVEWLDVSLGTLRVLIWLLALISVIAVLFFLYLIQFVLFRIFLRRRVKILFDIACCESCCLAGITLFPFICVCDTVSELQDQNLLRVLMKHELIHIEQVRRYGCLEFYLSYGLIWLACVFVMAIRFLLKGCCCTWIGPEESCVDGLNRLHCYEFEAYVRENDPLTSEEREELGHGLCTSMEEERRRWLKGLD